MEQEMHHYAATTNEATVLAGTNAVNGTRTNVNFGCKETAYSKTDATSSMTNEHQHQAPVIHRKYQRTSQHVHHHQHVRHHHFINHHRHMYTTIDHHRRKSIHGTERAVKSDEARKEKTEKDRPVKKLIEMYSLRIVAILAIHTMQVAMETGKLAIPPR